MSVPKGKVSMISREGGKAPTIAQLRDLLIKFCTAYPTLQERQVVSVDGQYLDEVSFNPDECQYVQIT